MLNTVGFKEWSRVCDRLGSGATSLILRKGGIHEGRAGFNFKEDSFWLFPTFFHAQEQGLNLPPHSQKGDFSPETERETVEIQYFARIEALWNLEDEEALRLIRPWHDWSDQVVLERFRYGDGQGIHVAAVRVDALPSAWSFPYEKKYGGCRSWVNLPSLPTELTQNLHPVLSDEQHLSRMTAIRKALENFQAS